MAPGGRKQPPKIFETTIGKIIKSLPDVGINQEVQNQKNLQNLSGL